MSSAVADGLRLLARKLVDEGHPLQAIKALHALLSQSLMPADEASVRLQLAQMLSEHTHNAVDAKKQLQRAVSFFDNAGGGKIWRRTTSAQRRHLSATRSLATEKNHNPTPRPQINQQDMIASQLPGDFALRARVLAALAGAHRALREPAAFERGALERGIDVCRAAAAARSDDWRSGARPVQDWAVYFRMRLADLDAREGNPAAAAAALKDAVTGGAAAGGGGGGGAVAAAGGRAALAASTPPNAAAAARQFPRFSEPRHRLPALLFRIQLAMARGDVDAARGAAEAAADLFAALDAPDAMPPEDEREQVLLLYAKLHFNVLQIMMYVRLGELETLLSQGGGGGGGGGGEEEAKAGGGGGGGGGSAADAAAGAAANGALGAVAYMQELLDATEGHSPPYEWLPREALAAVVHLLAVAVHRAGGAAHAREAARHADAGLAALAPALAALGCADAADAARAAAAGRSLPAPLVAERGLDRRDAARARLLLALRVLLGEARLQARLLATDLAGARAEAAAQMLLAGRFPGLLARLLPTVHLQAGLYAQAVGVWPAADAHFAAAVAGPADRPTAVAAAVYRALSHLAATPGPEAVARGATAMGPLYASAVGGGGGGGMGGGGGERPGDLTAEALAAAPGLAGNAERAASHVAVGLLRLRAGDVPAAKQRLQRALRLGHGRLRNQQLVAQVLHALAPVLADGGGGGGGGIDGGGGGGGGGSDGGALAASAGGPAGLSDLSGAESMLASSSTLCRGSGDVEGQTAALGLLAQLFSRPGGGRALAMAAPEQRRRAAQSGTYLAKKRAQLSERLAAAEGGDPAEHRAVLAWGLGT